MKIRSFNEWDQLKECYVGIADHANWPTDDPVFSQESEKTVWKETTKGRVFKEYRSVREKLQTVMKSSNTLDEDIYTYMENLQDKTGKEIQEELTKTIYCWDAYALSLIFVSFLIETSMYEEIDNPIFTQIKQYMEDIVTSIPSNRKTNSELKEEWLSIIENMDKQEWTELNDEIVVLSDGQNNDENKKRLLMSRESEIINAVNSSSM